MTQVRSLNFALQQSNLLRAHATASRFDPHLHSTYSVVALRRGEAEIRSERWIGRVRAGDVFFFNPYEVHSAHCSGKDADYATLYLSQQLLTDCLNVEFRNGPPRIQTAVLNRSTETNAFIDALFTSCGQDATFEAPLRRILGACNLSADPAPADRETLAARACLLIQNNCTRAMRTEDLARELGVHRSHLIRCFSATVGMAPQTYIRQVRVAKARELICAGVALSEVALMLEFSDQAHLSREFKKVFGVPPGVLSRVIRRSTAQ